MRIPHSKPLINAEDIVSVSAVLRTGLLAQGKKVQEFERALSRYVDTAGAVAVNSGTSALHLGLLAIGVGQGDEVIIPSFACSALLNAVLYTGATPKIADVDPSDFNIDPRDVKIKMNRKTKAVIATHTFGNPADLNALVRLGIPVIEDCAQSIGAQYNGRKVGSLGILSTCSFYATKVLTTGEGGMVLSGQKRLLDKVRDLREYDNVAAHKVRYNYKMTDFQAALGLSQFARLPNFLKRRKIIAGMYDAALSGLIVIPFTRPGREHIYFRYVLKVKRGRQALLQKLKKRGIEAGSPIFGPLHRYFDRIKCPVSDALMEQCVSIPIYPGLTDAQAQYIVKSF